jgi:hypothetical protein
VMSKGNEGDDQGCNSKSIVHRMRVPAGVAALHLSSNYLSREVD